MHAVLDGLVGPFGCSIHVIGRHGMGRTGTCFRCVAAEHGKTRQMFSTCSCSVQVQYAGCHRPAGC